MIRDDRQLVTVRSAGGDMRPVLRTYNAAGVLLGTSVWEGYVCVGGSLAVLSVFDSMVLDGNTSQ